MKKTMLTRNKTFDKQQTCHNEQCTKKKDSTKK